MDTRNKLLCVGFCYSVSLLFVSTFMSIIIFYNIWRQQKPKTKIKQTNKQKQKQIKKAKIKNKKTKKTKTTKTNQQTYSTS